MNKGNGLQLVPSVVKVSNDVYDFQHIDIGQ